ncbi:MAG TPA: RAMP superfamily CRISPR-associated protein [Thermoanaerobaculia bacterium]|nr:RAMP superfamily CRISPR-associated protein [Thermoanaerobaculia bacterium]
MPTLEITLQGHLLVAGGQASDLGVDLSTARRFDGQDWIPYIPATALRGAVRLQLEALLHGTDQPAAGPYPIDTAPRPNDLVARLFGQSGPLRKRGGSLEGALRFGDALPVDPAAALRALSVRPGLEIDDDLASAAQAKLFFREVAEMAAEPLVFRAPLQLGKAEGSDVEMLRAATETTDAVGAGKSKGGGAVSIRWLEEGDLGGTRVLGDADTAERARLVFTLTEPAHFGDGGPFGNHHATRLYIPGTTVRGAVAWALLREKKLVPESAEFRALFLDEAQPVSFGDALLALDPLAEPTVAPATRRQRRGLAEHHDDILVRELARERVNEILGGQGVYLRADDGDDRFDAVHARPDEELIRRRRTRVSIDRATGASAEGKLFSIEHLEAWLLPGARADRGDGRDETERRPTTFVSVVEGPASALRHLALLERIPVLIGAGRNRGLGQVALEVRFEAAPPAAGIGAVRAFAAEIDRCAAQLVRRTGLPIAAAGFASGPLPLALVALSDFVATDPEAPHPLAEPALNDFGLANLKPVRMFLQPGASGGYDQTPGRAPLKELVPAVGAGSVFVYLVEEALLERVLGELLITLLHGVGRHRVGGCGRFGLFAGLSKEKS